MRSKQATPEQLDQKRSLYDCAHAKVSGGRIRCEKGCRFHPTSQDRGLPLVHLKAGRPLVLVVCQSCPDFEQMDGGPVLPADRGWKDL